MTRRKFLSLIPALALLLLSPPSLLLAQTPTTIAVPFQTAQFIWTWEQGSGSPAEWFEISCGGNVVRINDPAARSYLVKDVISSPGAYSGCTVVAGNSFGASNPAVFSDFQAGTVPNDPIDATVGVQGS